MFKVGDIVRVRKDLVAGNWYGDFVLLEGNMQRCVGKEVEVVVVNNKGYKCCYKEEDLYFYFSPEMLEPISKAKEYTLIVTDKKVIILDKENKKKGISTCHGEDTFDFSIGVRLAWDRLHGIEEKKIDTPKPVEYKLYDCNGVELKEGDEVYNINLNTGDTPINNIGLVSGILYNCGLNSSHRADRNDGKYDSKNSLYKWKVLKK